MNPVVLFLLLPLLLAASSTSASEGSAGATGGGPSLERSVDMGGSGCSDVSWTVDRASNKVTISLRGRPGAGWVGIGLSEYGSMKGADVALITKSSDGTTFDVEDAISVDFGRPRPDTLQNVELLDASVDADGRMTATIRRDVDTCDRDDIAVMPYKQYLICASGETGGGGGGEALFHGPHHGVALVNLMVDEDLLFNRKLPTLDRSRRADWIASDTEPDAGLVVYAGGDDSAAAPTAIDVQMPNITLDRSQRTAYMCRVFTLSMDVRTVAYESVWGDGLSADDGPQPEYLHHQSIFKCDDDVVLPLVAGSGDDVFDCLAEMPSCDSKVNYAKSRILQAPAGIHIPLERGTYLLLVHYDNPRGAPIEDDRSGLRLWAEPPSVPSSTSPGQIMIGNGQLESVRIPADPNPDAEYSLQFQISSEATGSALPPGGVQVFASGVHMHKRGLRSRLQLIRDGVHMSDVFDTVSYDFDMQTPSWKPWRLLPGDALVMTCTYRPLPDADVVGGLRTSDEMCLFGLAFAPALPQSVTAVGFMVKPDEPFKNSFLGPLSTVTDTSWSFHYLDYSEATYRPNAEGRRDFVPLKSHQQNLCDVVVRDRGDLPRIAPSEANVTGQIVLIASFFFCLLVGKAWPAVRNMESERIRRNTVVYLGQLIFGTVALPFFIIALVDVFQSRTTFDAVHPETYTAVRALLVGQTILFLIELFYRIGVRAEVALHHLFTSGLVLFLHVALDKSFAFHAVFKMGVLLMLMALTDHPVNVALLLKNLGYARRAWWPRLCKAAGASYVLAKLVLASLTIKAMADMRRGDDASWTVSRHSFSRWAEEGDGTIGPSAVIAVTAALLFGLLSSQMYVGVILWRLGNIYEEKIALLAAAAGGTKPAGFGAPRRCLSASSRQVAECGTDLSETDVSESRKLSTSLSVEKV